MNARIPLIAFTLFGLTAFSLAADTDEASDPWLCTSNIRLDTTTRQALRIEIGSSTPQDVKRLLGTPWRTNNDADCDETQYSRVWEYTGKDLNGGFFRIHVAFGKDGKVSMVARITQGGRPLVLAYAIDKDHQH